MPENTDTGSQLSPAQLTARLAARLHGPYDDLDTVGAADLTAAAYRLLTALGDWLTAEAAAGRVGDDHRRPPADLIALIRAAFSQADDHADGLADALSTAHNLASTLHAAVPAAPAA